MAIQILRQKERQTLLALVFFVLMILTSVVIFTGISKRRGIAPTPIVVTPAPPKKIEINLEVLKSEALRELQPIEEISLPEEKGRDNPFLPYEEKPLEKPQAGPKTTR